MSEESPVSDRWYPERRTVQTWYLGGTLLLSLVQVAGGLDASTPWHTLVGSVIALILLAALVVVRTSRVEASSQGLRIVRPPFTGRTIAWRDITLFRREPPNVWSSRIGVVLHDGEVVDLHLSVDDRPDLVERWRRETGS